MNLATFDCLIKLRIRPLMSLTLITTMICCLKSLDCRLHLPAKRGRKLRMTPTPYLWPPRVYFQQRLLVFLLRLNKMSRNILCFVKGLLTFLVFSLKYFFFKFKYSTLTKVILVCICIIFFAKNINSLVFFVANNLLLLELTYLILEIFN